MSSKWKDLSYTERAEYELLAQEEKRIYDVRYQKYHLYLKMQPEAQPQVA